MQILTPTIEKLEKEVKIIQLPSPTGKEMIIIRDR
jgi:hypothetical protein